MTRKAYVLARAVRDSLPILMGYGTMGFAAGVVFAVRSGAPHPALWSCAIGLTAFSGTLHFAIGDWFGSAAALGTVALLTLAISFRYALYGFALASRWRGLGLVRRLFLIGGLADENAALEMSCRLTGADFARYCTILTALDMAYWCVGATAGAWAGATLPLPSRGVEFVMAALFLVILTDQVRDLSHPAREASHGRGAA